jgi:hypothetical protein
MPSHDSLDPDNALLGAVDTLSPLAHNLLKLGRADAYARPVVRGGGGNDDARAMLEIVQPDQLLGVPVTNPTAARAMLSGLWLWHDWLDESHTISQSLHDADGSFWHAIMHRREGDFWNSKYWYDKVGSRHPAVAAIGQHAGAAINHLPADKSLLRLLSGGGGWSPHAFVDLVEEVSGRANDPRLPAVVAVQRIEWQLLFDHCTRRAGGK